MKAATTVQVNFRVDDAIKRKADIILNGIGISMSSALNIFLRQVVARQAIPMELKYDPLTDPARLEQAFSDYENGRRNYHFHELPPLPEDNAEVPVTKKTSRHAKALV